MDMNLAAAYMNNSGEEDKMGNELTNIAIPADLYKEIEAKIKDMEIASVEDYVIKVLKDSLPEAEKEEDGLSKDEEDKVKERLKALGYMD
jgi:hypothetical protein